MSAYPVKLQVYVDVSMPGKGAIKTAFTALSTRVTAALG